MKKIELNLYQWIQLLKIAPKQKQVGYSLIIMGALLIIVSFVWILFV